VAWRALAEIALLRRQRSPKLLQPACHPGATVRCDRRQPGPGALWRHCAARARAAARLRRLKHSRAAGGAVLRCSHTVSASVCTRWSATASSAGWPLGYAPEGAPDFGLDRERFASTGERYAVLLHATARPGKAMAGGELDRARTGAKRAGHRARVAVGHRCGAGAQRKHRRSAAACPCARRAHLWTRSHG